MRISLITTVLNEEDSIMDFLNSITAQTKSPDEIVIVDGGSIDKTVESIKHYVALTKRIKIRLLIEKGNRSAGRNTAIKNSFGDIIAVSDAGCILDKNWLKNITKPFEDKDIDVVSGFYKPVVNSVFEKCLSTYTCVMPDKVNPKNFLPSSRSIAFKKSAWEAIKGYPESLDTCEDLVFARKLKENYFKLNFEEKAIVYWPQRKNLTEAFKQFLNYAIGDGRAFYIRPQTHILFARYLIGIIMVIVYFTTKSNLILSIIYYLLFIYITWSIMKNFRYVKSWQSLFILPALQITSDIAVISGTSIGIVKRFLKDRPGYAGRAARGVFWIGLFRFTSRIIAYGRIAILARILSPAQFGVYGIATLILEFLETFTETGVNVVLVQEKGDIRKYINSAWIVSITRGFLIGIAIFISAPFISVFFKSEGALYILSLISVVPILRGFINPAVVKFQKELEFKKEFIYSISSFAVYSISAIIFALLMKSALSLVMALILTSAFEILISFLIVKPRPNFSFDKNYIGKIIHRGKWITVNGILTYLFRNTDDIVVGRLLGTSPLGLYQMAYNLGTIPISEVADVLGKVTFPVFVKISADKKRLKSAFLKTTFGTSIFSLGVAVLLVVFPQEIVLFVLGKDWLGAVEVLRFLAIYAVLRSIVNPALTVFLALGRQDLYALVSLIGFLSLAILILPLVLNFGIVGAGIATIVASVISLPVIVYHLARVFKN